MELIRIKDDIIRLDLIVRIKEGRTDETYYGRSVRKSSGGWLELHFIDGEVMKLEGESAELLRRHLDRECKVKDLSAEPGPAAGPPPVLNGGWHPHRNGDR